MSTSVDRESTTRPGGSGGRALMLRRVVLLAGALVLMVVGTRDIRALRAYRETVVVSTALTSQIPLSTYFGGVKGTLMDAPVYVFDSGVPGGSVLLIGGEHPYEPASPVAAYVVMENIVRVTTSGSFVP